MIIWAKIEVTNINPENKMTDQEMMDNFVKLVKALNREKHAMNDTEIKIVYFNHNINECGKLSDKGK